MQLPFPTLESVSIQPGTRVLLRASLNAPTDEAGNVSDPARLIAALPTISLLREVGARIIVISHRSGNPQEATMAPIVKALAEHVPVRAVGQVLADESKAVYDAMQNGDVIVAENIRIYPEEEANDAIFAQQLAELADVFVQDDFTVAHREHAAVVSVPQYIKSVAGLQFAKEYEELSHARDPQHPALFVFGGAKPETKLPLAAESLIRADHVFIGGVSANVLLRARGISVGKSVAPRVLFDSGLFNRPEALLPQDVRVIDATAFDTKTDTNGRVVKVSEVGAGEMIMDAGPETVDQLIEHAARARCILWNGPLGDYERGFLEATTRFAEALSKLDAHTIVGGGDTIAAIDDAVETHFSFVSTAGGAMLDFLLHGTLPGIEALESED